MGNSGKRNTLWQMNDCTFVMSVLWVFEPPPKTQRRFKINIFLLLHEIEMVLMFKPKTTNICDKAMS